MGQMKWFIKVKADSNRICYILTFRQVSCQLTKPRIQRFFLKKKGKSRITYTNQVVRIFNYSISVFLKLLTSFSNVSFACTRKAILCIHVASTATPRGVESTNLRLFKHKLPIKCKNHNMRKSFI